MPAALPFVAMAFVSVGGIATALGATLGIAFTIGATAVTWAAVATITGLALTAISALAMKMPKPGSAGQQLNTKLDDKLPVPVAYGRTATGGSAIYRQAYGKKNRYLALVAVLSVGPIAGVESYAANDTVLPFPGDPHTGPRTTPGVSGSKLYRNKLTQRWQRGELNAPLAITQASGQPLPGSPGKLSGLAHTIGIYDYDTDQFPQGLPGSVWVLRGLTLYDPRKDSTYPGGAGSHRRDNPTTWEFSENPYLAALDWTLGRYQNGQKVHGICAKWGEVDVAAFIAGANVADANGWKIGGVVTAADDKFAVLSTILQAGGGLPVSRGAQISCSVNAPKTVTFTLRASDIIGDVEIMNSTSWRNRLNSIVPTYREETQNWELYTGEEVSVAQWRTDDGGEKKTGEISFPLVQQAAQAHQLATYDLCNSREFLTVNVTAKIRALAARVGDAIVFDCPELAINGQKCLVVSREFNPADMTVNLSLKSETDSKHPFALGQSQVPPPTPALSGYDPSNPGAPDATAWSITDSSIVANGVSIPAIVIAGENDDPNTAAIIVQYRPVGATEWASAGDYVKTSRVIEITSVTRNTAYEVAIRYRTVRGVLSEPLILLATAGAQTIDWSTGVITGSNRPADGATVGAPAGTQIGGRPVEDVINAITDSSGTLIPVQGLAVAIAAAQAQIQDIIENGVESPDLTGLYASIGALEADADGLHTSLTSVQGLITGIQSSVSSITADIAGLGASITAAQGNITTINTTLGTHGASISTLQTTVSNHTGTLATHTTQISTANANISTNATSITTANTNIANLTTRVSSTESSITSSATAITNLTGRTATLETTVSAAGASITSLLSTTSTQTGQIATLQTNVATANTNISTNASAITNVQGNLATLTTELRAGSNPNQIKNGSGELGLSFWTAVSGTWNIATNNIWVSYFWVAGAGSSGDKYYHLVSDPVAVPAGTQMTASAGFDLYASAAGALAYVELRFLNASGAVLESWAGGTVPRGTAFSADVTTRQAVKVTRTAPAGTVTAVVVPVIHTPNGVSLTSGAVRQIKLEVGALATPYSADATIVQQATALKTLDTSFASLSTTVSSQGGSITTLQSSMTNAQGNISTLQSTVTTQGGQISSNATAISSLSGTTSTLSSNVSAQGASINSLQTAQSTAAGQISTLQTQVSAGGGNLLLNTDLAIDTAGWVFSTGNSSVGERVASGDPWIVAGENGLRILQNNAATSSQGDWTQTLAAEAGKWYDVSVYAASHRANIQIYLQFINSSGTVLVTPSTGLVAPTGGGNTIANFVPRSFKYQAPAGTVSARLYLRKFGTLAGADMPNSYAWFLRPQVAETLASSSSPLAYSVGGAGASVTSLSSAISTTNGSMATLSSTVSTQASSISTMQTAITSTQGSVASLSSTVSTQGASISTLQTTTSTTQGDVASLRSIVQSGSPNLLKNGGFSQAMNYWSATHTGWNPHVSGGWGQITDRAGTWSGDYCYMDSERVPCFGGTSYTLAADSLYYLHSGAGHCYTEMVWWDGAGNVLGQVSGTAYVANHDFSATGGGRNIHKLTAASPANAASVSARLVHYKVGAASVNVAGWRQVKLEQGSQMTAYSSEASIVQQSQTLSSLSSSYASLSTTVSSLNSSVSTQQTAITDMQGRTSAYWKVEAVAGGRAQLKVYADANGGGGVDIGGDLRVNGNVMVTGSINPEALALHRFVQRASASVSGTPIAGQSTLLHAASLGNLTANGSYTLQIGAVLTYNSGSTTTTVNGKPYYTGYLFDGGVRVVVTKNGVPIITEFMNGSSIPHGGSLSPSSFNLTKNFDNIDATAGEVVLAIYSVRGNADTGQVNEGDYYSREVSGSYTAVSANVNLKWTFV